MTATTGSDVSGPVEYLFTETSGNAGGTSSGWQSSPVYTDTGLTALTQYSYTVTMRDALGNTGTASDAASATTGTNIDADPLFVDAENGDYRLASNSPCIDFGDSSGDYTGQTDVDGNSRVIDIAGIGDGVVDVDMGAYEYGS